MKGKHLQIQHLTSTLLLLGLLSCSLFSHAQTKQISGTVRDQQGLPLPGANIVVQGTTFGTTSDAEGKYSLELAPAQNVLVVSFIGYFAQEVEVGNQTTIDVSLSPDVQTLTEVVVTG